MSYNRYRCKSKCGKRLKGHTPGLVWSKWFGLVMINNFCIALAMILVKLYWRNYANKMVNGKIFPLFSLDDNNSETGWFFFSAKPQGFPYSRQSSYCKFWSILNTQSITGSVCPFHFRRLLVLLAWTTSVTRSWWKYLVPSRRRN
jgi:hypothetical protein